MQCLLSSQSCSRYTQLLPFTIIFWTYSVTSPHNHALDTRRLLLSSPSLLTPTATTPHAPRLPHALCLSPCPQVSLSHAPTACAASKPIPTTVSVPCTTGCADPHAATART
eukprot:362534-Chlamydomonas_euryale.AAC.7